MRLAAEEWFDANEHWMTHIFPMGSNSSHDYTKYKTLMFSIYQQEFPEGKHKSCGSPRFLRRVGGITRAVRSRLVQPRTNRIGERKSVGEANSSVYTGRTPQERAIHSRRMKIYAKTPEFRVNYNRGVKTPGYKAKKPYPWLLTGRRLATR
jgi:hypothetical protein